MTEDYVPRNILVTGAAGFIASHVVDKLLVDFPKCQITILDILDYCSSKKNIESAIATGRCKLVVGDIRNMNLISYLLIQETIDTVLHFAAISHVDLSFGDSLVFTQVNCYGSHVLLEGIRLYNQTTPNKGVERCIMVSSDEIYGSQPGQSSESSPRAPTNPYSASKASMECICNSYMKSYGIPIIITRGNNCYGPRIFVEKVIPKFITLLEAGRPLPIHGNGTQRRSFMYVSDAAAAFSIILQKGQVHQVYNIQSGEGEEFTIMEVAQKLLKHFKIPEDKWNNYIKNVDDRAFNDQRYFIDGKKLRDLGWKPVVDFDSGIDITIEWYKSHHKYWDNAESALADHPKLTTYLSSNV
jgi:UDP-glucose 4,6-dehydratase